MRFLTTNTAVFSLSFFSVVHSSQCDRAESPYRITARHIDPQGIGYNQGYTTLEGFFSLYNGWEDWVPFLDVRGHVFNNGRAAVNAGLGLRYLREHLIWGINSYYDYRNTKHQHYNQVALGLECLGSLWDFRLNGYLPVGKKESPYYDLHFDHFAGNSAIVKERYEYALGGFNGEVGAHVNSWEKFPLYFAAGPYYLHGKGASTWGGQLRASLRMCDYLKIDGNVSYDHLFKWIGQGQVGISFYFEGRKKTRCCPRSHTLKERSYQPVDRFEIIAVDKKERESSAIDPITHLPYQFIFVDNTSSSLGTYASPYRALVDAETNSSPYDIIYVFPGDGTTAHMDHGISLKPNQRLWGAASPYILSTTQGVITIPQLSSTSPQITNVDLLGAGVTLSTNNEVNGITFTETSGQAIFGTNPETLKLTSCKFVACGQGDLGIFPVLLQTSSPFRVNILQNTFTDNPNAGVFVQLLDGASSTQITMNDNQAYNNQVSSGSGAILSLEDHGQVGVCTLVMQNNVYENNDCSAVHIADLNAPQDGSFSSFHASFFANKFTGNAQGITFAANADTCTMSIKNNDLSDNLAGSLLVLNGVAGTQLINTATLVIDSNQMNQGGSSGDAITIQAAGDTLSVTLTNNSISNNRGSAFVSFFNQPGPNATLVITNNTIADNLNSLSNASGGISFDGFSAVTALIDKNTFSNNAQGNSIGFYGSSFVTPPDTSTVRFTNNQLTGDTFDFESYANSPATSCLTIFGNTSTINPTYTFQQQGSGSCFIVPCNYETENTGGFNLSGVTPSRDCTGSGCP